MERVYLRPFSPVSIKVGDRYNVVTTVMDAAKLLVSDDWPRHQNRAQSDAYLAIVEAFNDKVNPITVR